MLAATAQRPCSMAGRGSPARAAGTAHISRYGSARRRGSATAVVAASSAGQLVREWLRRLMKEHNVTTITSTGHSLGGGLATICGFGVGELLHREWAEWDKTGWKTKAPPKVTIVSFAAPRVGNYTFVRKLREFGVRTLRIINKGDFVPKVPGIIVQLLSNVLASVPVFGRRADIDMDSPLVLLSTTFYFVITVLCSPFWPSRWGYFHAGQVLEVDSDNAEQRGTVMATSNSRQKHNLELHLYLLSKLVPGGQTIRNPLLLNKSNDLLLDKRIPARWWEAPDRRGCKLHEGRWVFPGPK